MSNCETKRETRRIFNFRDGIFLVVRAERERENFPITTITENKKTLIVSRLKYKHWNNPAYLKTCACFPPYISTVLNYRSIHEL